MKEAKMGMKRKFGGRTYSLVAIVRNKKDLQTYAKNQRSVGSRIRITRDNWAQEPGTWYTAWHGGYR